MTILASDVLRGVITELQDDTNVRWTIPELCRYFNDGQRALATARPDATVTTATLALSAGSRQALPAGGKKLLDVVRNTGGAKRAVRQVSREILDSQIPGWHGLTGVTEVKHFIYDVREPTIFYVYPPAAVGASLELVYGAEPTSIAIPADGSDLSGVSGNMGLPDQYANPLRDYVLFRAYLKDAEYAANQGRADMHLKLFGDQLGLELTAAQAMAPGGAGNPNMLTPRGPRGSA